MRTQSRQRGITMIGFVIMLCVVGFFAYAGMKLVPAYTEYYGVIKSLKSLQLVPNIDKMSIDLIRRKLDPIFDVQYVDEENVPLDSVTLITTNGQRSVHIAYDRDIPFIYNIDLLVHFEKTVDISNGGTY